MTAKHKHWILADAHAGTDSEADEGLLRLLERAEAERAELLILGDLFRIWVGRPKFWDTLEHAVMERIQRVRQVARVTFVVGNRDYLVEDALFDRVLREGTRLDLGGVPTWVAHGDGIDPDDRLYRAWARVSRGIGARALARTLPTRAGRALIQRLESTLEGTNQAYKAGSLPMRAIEALGRHARAQGAERALIGHFHADERVEVEGGAPVIIAPAWLDHRRILEINGDGAFQSISPD